MKYIYAIALLFVSQITVAQSEIEDPKVLIRLNLRDSEMRIQSIPGSIDIAGQDLEKNTLDIVGSPEYFELLKDSGYSVEIIREQIGGIDPRYQTYAKIVSNIRALQEKYPELVHVESIGNSLRGKPIFAVRISTPDNIDYKPTILFNGMHHAREIMTTEITTDIMNYLVTNYDNPETPWVNVWLKNLAIWILPQFNPDGNDIAWTKDNWWRKNARGDSESTWGVDLNRNYPYEWGTCGGSSGSQRNQTYRGEKAASEPETISMMKFVKDKNFAMDISYHSYSELVIAPYGCQDHLTPENMIVREIGASLAKKLKTDDGRGTYRYGTGWEILYPVDGDDISWMYNEVNTLAYVIEVNGSDQGFQPSYDEWRDKTVIGQRAGWNYLLNRMVAGPQLRGRMLDAKTGQPIDGFVSINGLAYKDEKPRASKNGIFFKPLIAGSYEFNFAAPGYRPQTLALSLDADSIVTQDIFFEALEINNTYREI